MLCTTQYFWGVDAIYSALISTFGACILFILWIMQYFRGVDIIYSIYYAVFSRVNTIYTMQYFGDEY